MSEHTSTAHFSESAAPALESQRQIRPLGEQIIIRVLPPSSVGSIIIPDSAKGSTHQGEGGSLVHFVEAEVIAVGPGRRRKDPQLMEDMVEFFRAFFGEDSTIQVPYDDFIDRFENRNTPLPLEVKLGDHILYHPAVQSFDRKIDPALIGLPQDAECYICNEQTSVLAVLERDE
jgi:co-chaperonin GroES (HSP10)